MILLVPAVVVTALSIVRASTSSNPLTVNPGRARSVAERIGTRPALTPRARHESTAVHQEQPSATTIGVSDGHLTLGGLPYRFVGVNAYELATDWGTNSGCGANETDAEPPATSDGFQCQAASADASRKQRAPRVGLAACVQRPVLHGRDP